MLIRKLLHCGSYWLCCGLLAAASAAAATQEVAKSAARMGLPSPVIKLYEDSQPRYLPLAQVVADSAVVNWFNGVHSSRWLTLLDKAEVASAVANINDCIIHRSDFLFGCLRADVLITTLVREEQWEWMETANLAYCDEREACTSQLPLSFQAEWPTHPNFTLYSAYRGRGEAVLIWHSRQPLSQLYQQALALARSGGKQLLEHDMHANLAMSVTFREGKIDHQLRASTSNQQATIFMWAMRMAVPL